MSSRNSRIDNEIGDADMASILSARVRGRIVSIAILGIALGLIFVLSSNWTTWVSGGEEQKTDDAYLRADVTPLSTKAAGLVASVEVSDYQPVKAGDLLARLQDDDFRAQVAQAEAAVQAGDSALVNNRRQKELQDARIQQAQTAIVAAEAEISTAEAGIQAANSALANARSRISGIRVCGVFVRRGVSTIGETCGGDLSHYRRPDAGNGRDRIAATRQTGAARFADHLHHRPPWRRDSAASPRRRRSRFYV